jgi:hypothetical protein
MHKCLNFVHEERAVRLRDLCREFGGWFIRRNSPKVERGGRSYLAFYETRCRDILEGGDENVDGIFMENANANRNANTNTVNSNTGGVVMSSIRASINAIGRGSSSGGSGSGGSSGGFDKR